MSKGFTLLELLIVIGIIGILAGVFFISYNGYREKASISNSMRWAQSVHSELGLNAVSVLTFERSSGSTIFDDSGNINNGTAAGTYSIINDGAVKKAIQLTGGRVDISGTAIMGTAMTFSGWFKKINATWASSIAFMGKRSGSNGWMLYRNSGDSAGYFRWYSWYVNTSDAIVSYRAWPGISGLVLEKWYFIAVSRDAIGNLRIYLDGKEIYQGTPPADFKSWSDVAGNIAIGAERAGSSGYLCTGAVMDDVRIYREYYTKAQIEQLYVQGLKKYQNLAFSKN